VFANLHTNYLPTVSKRVINADCNMTNHLWNATSYMLELVKEGMTVRIRNSRLEEHRALRSLSIWID